MKKILLLLALCSTFMLSAQKSKLTLTTKFTNIEEGYEHDSKIKVFVDGKEVFESAVFRESEPQSFKLKIPKGKHKLLIQNLTLYEGVWEETTRENSYSIDGFIELEKDFPKKFELDIEFNLDEKKPIVHHSLE